MTAIRLAGRWTLEDRLCRQVWEVPFTPPPGTRALTVELAYDREAGVLDLGCFGPDGFRGWSGGARSTYTIAPSWATPGYLPGEPEPGTWHVLLGLYRVPLAGLAYEITVTPHRTPPPAPAPSADPGDPAPRPAAAARRNLPPLDGMTWLAGDLHAHTVHSDGTGTVPELARLAAGRGLDYLAVTDHNTTSHHPELPAAAARAAITLVPGQEVTTDLGHANALGDIGWIDFRRPAGQWADDVRDRGGVLSINHPVAGDCAWRQPIAPRPRVAEVWHWSWWDRTWGAPLSWARAWCDDPVFVGGSDFHRPGEGPDLGSPTTWVLSDGDRIVEGVRAGRTAVSATPAGPLLVRHGDEFLAIDAEGLVLWGPETREVIRAARAVLPARPGPHRLETPRNEVMALCT